MRVITSKVTAGPCEWILPPVHHGRYTSKRLRVVVKHIEDLPPGFKKIGSNPAYMARWMGKRQCSHAGVGFCLRCKYPLLP